MSSQYDVLRDHIADFLIFLSRAPSFWFLVNTSYGHGRHLCQFIPFGPGRLQGCVTSRRAACHLVVPAGCRIASCRPLIVPPSSQLVAIACCCITSPHPLIALPFRRLVPPAGCRIASCHPLVAPPSCQLVAPACCRIASPRPLVAPRAALSSSRRAVWLLRRLSMRRPLVVSSCCLSLSHRASW